MNVTIRLLTERDLPATRRIISLAFGTFLGVPEPEQFRADRDYATTRWHTDPATAFVAEMDGTLVGSNFVTRWVAWVSSVRLPCTPICGIVVLASS
ncbi:hypothetical protein B188_26430 [Candidatus Brocadiaceae bacterium B188]|nr:hypothetical protein B188_26430 [Candidatus Brocadiaceae bacterium B188]